MQNKFPEISKFLSYVLRHQPDAIGIKLDLEGWTDIDILITSATASGMKLNNELIKALVATSDKQRFALSADGLRIRALQGHSNLSVDIKYAQSVPMDFLYHGTATRFLKSICEKGLLPRSRRYVHLSRDEETAMRVGQRHGKAVALKIEALLMHEQGFMFFEAGNGVWLTECVPCCFIKEQKLS